jgi:hypothetical protein
MNIKETKQTITDLTNADYGVLIGRFISDNKKFI